MSRTATLAGAPESHRSVELMSCAQMGKESALNARYWYAQIAAGSIAYVRLGRLVRVERREFERFLATHSVPASA